MTLDELAKKIEALRHDALFDDDLAVALDPLAESELMSGLIGLELARQSVVRADLNQTRALAQAPRP